MSIRYGISVIPQPRFTARIYRARQLICGQYASWAAEMHMVHMPLIEYFSCPDDLVQSLENGLEAVARAARDAFRDSFREPGPGDGIALAHRGVAAAPGDSGNIFLDFIAEEASRRGESDTVQTINQLRDAVVETLGQVYGAASHPDMERMRIDRRNHPLRIALMLHANLPSPVFASALAFAQSVVADLEVPEASTAWQLVLIRFESDAADAAGADWGDWGNWNRGLWAADLRWQVINSYPLSPIR